MTKLCILSHFCGKKNKFSRKFMRKFVREHFVPSLHRLQQYNTIHNSVLQSPREQVIIIQLWCEHFRDYSFNFSMKMYQIYTVSYLLASSSFLSSSSSAMLTWIKRQYHEIFHIQFFSQWLHTISLLLHFVVLGIVTSLPLVTL